MIRNIFFDFDGVIHNSNSVKTFGFRHVLKDYPPPLVDKLVDYHEKNGGISRYSKFRYFFEHILGREISEDGVNHLARKFSDIMVSELVKPEYLIAETVDFIRGNHKKYNMHVLSGADESELCFITEKLGIRRYFISIYGSPVEKVENTRRLLNAYEYRPEETVLIGDSINDFDAARANGIHFVGYNNKKLRVVSRYLETFNDAPALLGNLKPASLDSGKF